jgi:hypothetical protein
MITVAVAAHGLLRPHPPHGSTYDRLDLKGRGGCRERKEHWGHRGHRGHRGHGQRVSAAILPAPLPLKRTVQQRQICSTFVTVPQVHFKHHSCCTLNTTRAALSTPLMLHSPHHSTSCYRSPHLTSRTSLSSLPTFLPPFGAPRCCLSLLPCPRAVLCYWRG